MTGVEVGLVDGPVGVMGNLLRIGRNGAPEIRQVSILVVDRFRADGIRPRQEDGQRSGKWLNVIECVAEARPDEMGNARFPTKPRLTGTALLAPFHSHLRYLTCDHVIPLMAL